MIFDEYATPTLQYLAGNPWYITEKVDGTNIRVIWTRDHGLEFRGRTDKAQMQPRLLDALTDLFSADMFHAWFPESVSTVCLYGEGYGDKIQKEGSRYRPDQGFVLFDVWVDEHWLEWDSVRDTACKLGIENVPLICEGTLDAALTVAHEQTRSAWGLFGIEGVVARPTVPLYDQRGNPIRTKIKHKDFLS